MLRPSGDVRKPAQLAVFSKRPIAHRFAGLALVQLSRQPRRLDLRPRKRPFGANSRRQEQTSCSHEKVPLSSFYSYGKIDLRILELNTYSKWTHKPKWKMRREISTIMFFF